MPHFLFPSRRVPLARRLAILAIIAVLAGCATRPINAPVSQFIPGKSYRVERPSESEEDNATLVILAFSGGGTRAAAFSYGVLETLRDIEVTTKSNRKLRALDTVDVITGISGGSFTALAYGLYGDKLFDILRRNPDGSTQSWQANSHWVRITIYPTGGKVTVYLTLSGDGREVELGAFLMPSERKALANDLRLKLAELRGKTAP